MRRLPVAGRGCGAVGGVGADGGGAGGAGGAAGGVAWPARPGLDAADVGWSLATTRSVFEHRAVVTGADREELAAGLAAVAAGPAAAPAPGVVTGRGGCRGKVVFVFPGQGAQWAGMGRELAAALPGVRGPAGRVRAGAGPVRGLVAGRRARRGGRGAGAGAGRGGAAGAVGGDGLAGRGVGGGRGDPGRGGRALARARSPRRRVAGILSLEDAARVVAVRSRALSGLGRAGRDGLGGDARRGGRGSCSARWDGRLSVAAVNGPAATVVSGRPAGAGGVRGGAVGPARAALAGSRRRFRRALAPGRGAGAGSWPRTWPASPRGRGSARLFSTVTGRWADGRDWTPGTGTPTSARTVRFAERSAALAAAGHRAFIEVSPHPVLTGAITETLEDGRRCPARCWSPAPCAATTPARPGCWPPWPGHTWHGVTWTGRRCCAAGQPVDLPTYAFQRQRYWPQTSAARGAWRGRRWRGDGRGGPVLGGGRGRGPGRAGRHPGGGRAAAVQRGAAGAGVLAAPGDEERRWPGLAVPGHLGAGSRPGRRPAVRDLAGHRRRPAIAGEDLAGPVRCGRWPPAAPSR